MLDSKDNKILDILTHNSRMKVRTIANKLKLPVTTVHKRIRKMEEDGIIIGYNTKIDYEKLGFPISAYVILKADYNKLKKMRINQLSVIKDILKRFPQADSGSVVTGKGRDMMIKVRTKSIKDLDNFLEAVRDIEGVFSTDTIIILGEVDRASQ